MNFKEIKELVGLLKESNLAEFIYKKDDFELKIKTDKFTGKVRAAPALPTAAPVAAVPVQTSAPAQSTDNAAEDSGGVSSNANLLEVKSPIVGTFYRSPGPDKDVFVKVGDSIEEGSVVCIVEAMKLFNEIESEIAGKIVKVLVDDATPVEYDQPLFLVEV
tara:strand:+ start:2013 stop:2495 length:483 start_codon:yes stop_codon:yes gene_type:complete